MDHARGSRRFHFISGLPRSGSTLLSAILRQNPDVAAGMTSPVASLVLAMQRHMSQENEAAPFIEDGQRATILRAIVEGYYAQLPAETLVLDTSRTWCSKMPLIARLFPEAKVIACVRDVRWIMDSVERLVRVNALEPSGLFGFEAGGTVYSRIGRLAGGDGLVGFALNALREAYYGEESARLLLVRYESLTSDPARVLSAVYDFLEEPSFAHDYENVVFDAEEFDRRLGTPGLHRVGRRVEASSRRTILPPRLFESFAGDAFWEGPQDNGGPMVV